MKLEDIQREWSEDAPKKDDLLILDEIAIDTYRLHNKYFKILSDERLRLKKYKQEFDMLYLHRMEFLNKTLDPDIQKMYGWVYFNHTILKEDRKMYMNTFPDIVAMNQKIAIQEEKVDYLEKITDMISSRNFNIRAAIDFMKFKNGG